MHGINQVARIKFLQLKPGEIVWRVQLLLVTRETFRGEVLGFLAYVGGMQGTPADWTLGSLSTSGTLENCGILLQMACRSSEGQNGVTITSKILPPMVLSSTHTGTVRTQWCPGLGAWLGLSLQNAGLSVSEKFSSHSTEGQEHYLH